MNRTRSELFGCEDFLKFDTLFSGTFDKVRKFRCRVIYGEQVENIELIPYQKQEIRRLKLIEANIQYPYKLLDRSELNSLFALRDSFDDVIIVQNGLITDTTIANIAVYDGSRWLTPKKPLLKGTMRQKLLDEKFIVEANIAVKDLQKYKKIAVMNALRGFEELVEFPV